MANKPQACEPCAKLCEEAKQNVKKLQKKVYVMTIVCTAAITLLGEQGAKALISVLDSTKTSINSSESIDEIEKIEEQKKEADVEILNFDKKTSKKQTKKYELTDELAKNFNNKEKLKFQKLISGPDIKISYLNSENKELFFLKINSFENNNFIYSTLSEVNTNNLLTNYNPLPLNLYGNGFYSPTDDDLVNFNNPVFVPEPSVMAGIGFFLILSHKRKNRL
jgi:hypothetical protein